MNSIDKDHIAEQARILPDDYLLDLVTVQAGEYEPSALEVYEFEVRQRGLWSKVEERRAVGVVAGGEKNTRWYLRFEGMLRTFWLLFVLRIYSHGISAIASIHVFDPTPFDLFGDADFLSWPPLWDYRFPITAIVVSVGLFFFGARIVFLIYQRERLGVIYAANYLKLVFWYHSVYLISSLIAFESIQATGYLFIRVLEPILWTIYLSKSNLVQKTFDISVEDQRLVKNPFRLS